MGDRPELFVGPIVALFLAWILVRGSVDAAIVGLVLFASVALVGAFSLYLTTRPRG